MTTANRYEGMTDDKIANLFPDDTTIAYAILKTLERHGLADRQNPPTANP